MPVWRTKPARFRSTGMGRIWYAEYCLGSIRSSGCLPAPMRNDCMRRTGGTLAAARGRLLTWRAKLTVSFLAAVRETGAATDAGVTGSSKLTESSFGPFGELAGRSRFSDWQLASDSTTGATAIDASDNDRDIPRMRGFRKGWYSAARTA